MLLNLNDDEFLENPDSSVVISTVKSLNVDTFAILSREEEDYIQTYHNEDGSYELEYRAGSYDKHFRATKEPMTRDDVVNAFAAYIDGKSNWSDAWEWEIVEFDEDFEGDLTYDNAYVLDGEEYKKIRVGEERKPIELSSGKCPSCLVGRGQCHERGCEFEECPRCHGPICGCDCE